MAKKKEIEVLPAELVAERPEAFKQKPSKIEFNFGNGDLNVLRNKLNEVIDYLD